MLHLNPVTGSALRTIKSTCQGASRLLTDIESKSQLHPCWTSRQESSPLSWHTYSIFSTHGLISFGIEKDVAPVISFKQLFRVGREWLLDWSHIHVVKVAPAGASWFPRTRRPMHSRSAVTKCRQALRAATHYLNTHLQAPAKKRFIHFSRVQWGSGGRLKTASPIDVS